METDSSQNCLVLASNAVRGGLGDRLPRSIDAFVAVGCNSPEASSIRDDGRRAGCVACAA